MRTSPVIMAFYTYLLTFWLQASFMLRSVHADTAVTAYAQPLPCFGFCLALDPGIIRRYDGVYFRYNTNGGIYFQKSSGTGSAGIAGPWVDSGPALPQHSSIDPSVANLWAPYVTRIGSTYIMYYTLSHINTRNSTIGYATSQTLEYGSWTDHGSTGITTQEKSPASAYNAIDPTLILVGSQYYMSFGSYWADIQIVPMNAAGTAPLKTFPAGVQQIEYQPAGSHATEASFVYQYMPPGANSSYFYLFWSEGIANGYDTNVPANGTEYRVRVCRSTNVTSGYVDSKGNSCLLGYGELVLASHDQVFGPGGQGILDDICGPIMYYAYANTSQSMANTNYKWGVNYLSWPNGWPIVSGTNSSQPLGYCTLSSTTSTAQTSTATTNKAQTSTIPTSGSHTSTAVTYSAQTSFFPTKRDQTSAGPTNSAQTSTAVTSSNQQSTAPTDGEQKSVAPTSQSSIFATPSDKTQISAALTVGPKSGGTNSVTDLSSPPTGACSITSVIYMFTSTFWILPDGHTVAPPGYVPEGGGGGGGSMSVDWQYSMGDAFGCVPVTSTIHV
ncbi:hypothetical protein N0V93_000692 [Gnomoniopsis smithogilvyi]|uniref:Arabinan endo-1,5-alpha-L-arabinosidase n=1 Tax=Gnomoniopsis smithogilvyi TaxID=1191159 RepID=A0A9W8Z2G0_9PEZI|nr:hypothetical protein N0V93_000692 [Gnomoniopsis smithogilvyi]